MRLLTRYAYDSAGHLSTMTYPSGLTVAYHYTDGRLTGLDLNGQPYIAAATYAPFGPVTGWDWSNGYLEQRSYDQDGQLVSQSLGPDQRTLAYDANGNITAIDDPHSGQSLGYDALNRLTDASDSVSNTSFSWQYDANGNRLSQSANGTTSTYGIDTNSNRLLTVDSTHYQYDADGNLTSDGTHTYGYDARNRLTSVDSSTTATYTYNALGQRVMKQALLPAPLPSTAQSHISSHAVSATANLLAATALFVYDTQGRLIGEYDASGAALEETVYFGPLPVATVRSGTPYAIHSDQLGTPRVITDPSDNVVWRWDSDPFGTAQPNERPSGKGKAFVYNLRFPGQYYDQETGLHYNYFRDYDPSTGRYIESDPIGLLGGINSFAYVYSNPLNWTDSLGLRTAVVINGPTSGNPFGHAAIAVTGSGIYSYGNATPTGSSVTDYLTKQASRRDTDVIIIDTTQEQEKAILDYLKRQKDNVDAYPDNCASRTSHAMAAGGMPDPYSLFGTNNFPTDTTAQAEFWRQALGGQTVSIPKNSTSLSPALTEFNPR